MQLRLLILRLSEALFKRDVDKLFVIAERLNTEKKLSNKDWEAFCKIAANYRTFLLD